jgi:C-terminal processing protease CtpA/Prc
MVRTNTPERLLTVDQAILLLDQLYVHLPLKKAMHAADPVQRLKVLRQRLAGLSDREFQEEMIEVLVSVKDMHTAYFTPDPARRRVAVLPFRVDRCVEDGASRYLVTALEFGFTHPLFTLGVEISHWNGVPIARAVEDLGAMTGAGNPDARHARGLASLTQRPLMFLPPPAEVWVVVTFLVNGQRQELRFVWQTKEVPAPLGAVATEASTVHTPREATLGLDRLVELQRRMRRVLFEPDLVELERRVLEEPDPGVDLSRVSALPHVLEFRMIGSDRRPIGYLRVRSFDVPDVDAFVTEVMRIVDLLPPGGLVIDVRGNGGGAIAAGERLLQLFTPRTIEPERCHFINTSLTLRLVSAVAWLAAWEPSMSRSVVLGTVYSDGFPIEEGHEERCNAIGQRYFGPVVLLVDALCYSATDIFAAGFQDHELGPVLGTAGTTGAGGANAWDLAFLSTLVDPPDSPFEPLSDGAGLSVAIRQTRRVGARAGSLLEDLGVIPDHVHQPTAADLLDGSRDLIARAVELVEQLPVRFLGAEDRGTENGVRRLRVTSTGLSRLDVLVDGRPRLTVDVEDGERDLEVPVPGPSPHRWELLGYDRDALAARRVLTLG